MFGKLKKENAQLKDNNNLLAENIKILEKRLRDKDKEIKTLKFKLENPSKYKVGKKLEVGKIISVDLVEPENVFANSYFHALLALDFSRALLNKGRVNIGDEMKKYLNENSKYYWLYTIEYQSGQIVEVKESEMFN